jgi:hypothetical protein
MGGKCFNNVDRICKQDIIPTVVSLEFKTGIRMQNNLLGSTGKKTTSGDIDIGLDSSQYSQNDVLSKLKSHLGDNNVRKIGKLITCRYPVYNKPGKFVQVDFLIGNLQWLKLFYHASSSTEYSGAHRNGAIRAILRKTNLKVLKSDKDQVGKEKHMWSPTNGLCRVKQTSYSAKKSTDTEILSTVNLDIIPSVIFSDHRASVYDLDSLETIIDAINKYYKVNAEDIFQEIANEFLSMKFDKEFVYPLCIQKYIRKL